MLSIARLLEKYPKMTDIHVMEGEAVQIRREGRLERITEKMDTETFYAFLAPYVSDLQQGILSGHEALDRACSEGKQRLRLHLYRVRGHRAASIRILPSLADLPEDGDSEWIQDMASLPNGLVLVTGPTGSGKTTLLARMELEISKRRPVHILTLEDPVEYIIPSLCAMVHQREKMTDFSTFPQGIRESLREDPDVLVIGELRDRETVRSALMAAETGHLVLATLHSRRCWEAVARMVHAFPEGEQMEIRTILSSVLRSVSSQVLFHRQEETVAVREILMVTSAISRLVRDGKYEQIRSYMHQSDGVMASMDKRALNLSRLWPEEEQNELLAVVQ